MMLQHASSSQNGAAGIEVLKQVLLPRPQPMVGSPAHSRQSFQASRKSMITGTVRSSLNWLEALLLGFMVKGGLLHAQWFAPQPWPSSWAIRFVDRLRLSL